LASHAPQHSSGALGKIASMNLLNRATRCGTNSNNSLTLFSLP
jgi:hypothetical protein